MKTIKKIQLLAARMESRLGIDKELKKVVDEIVSAVENSKHQLDPLC